MHRLLYIIMFMLTPYCAFAQKMDERIFTSICEATIEAGKRVQLQQEAFAGFYIVEDPVSGDRETRHHDTVSSKTIERFNKYSREEQFAILNADALPFFPLKDTVCIIDTSRFFDDGLQALVDRHFFKVAHKLLPETSRTTYLYLHKTRMIGNNLYIMLTFGDRMYYVSYTIDMASSGLKTTMSHRYSTTPSYE